MTALAPKVGGWVEFYRSPARKLWTPTGVNVPEYGKLAQVWWQNVSKAISGEQTPQQAMDGLARDQDAIMARLEKSGVQGKLGPKLNEEKTAEYWYAKAEKDGNLAPQRKLANEKPPGITVDYDELIKSWKAEKPKKAESLRKIGAGPAGPALGEAPSVRRLARFEAEISWCAISTDNPIKRQRLQSPSFAFTEHDGACLEPGIWSI